MKQRINARGCTGRQWAEREYKVPKQQHKSCRRLDAKATILADVWFDHEERLQFTAACTNCGARYNHTMVPKAGCLMCDLPWSH